MRRARLLPLDVAKEIRALLPTWLACMAAVAVASIFREGAIEASVIHRAIFSAGVLAYIFGSVALGALSIGHEYSDRTLPLLLSLPVSRRRIFAVKLGVLTAMLLVLSAVAMGMLGARVRLNDLVALGLLSLLGALFVAPWLTMACRNPLAGAVFALAIPGAIFAAVEVLTLVTYGVGAVNTPNAGRFRLVFLCCGMVALCAVAAVSSWRMFMRLQAIEGRDPHVRLPQWLRGPATTAAPGIAHGRRVHPIWWLARKELHLQELTFVVAGLYLLGWIVILRRGAALGGTLDQPLLIWTVMFGAVEALLSGSLASAEERQFGTLEAQVLLPMATATQWAVKTGVALGLTVVLAVGLPFLLASLSPTAGGLRVNFWYVGTVIILTAGSLYVSSLCSSGLRALLMSFPAILVVLVLLSVLGPAIRFHAPPMLGLATVFVVLMLRFGLVNHRSSERGAMRVWRQLSWMFGSMALAAVIFAGAISYVA